MAIRLPRKRLRELATRATLRPPLSRLLCFRGARSVGKIALTFDDGPDPEYTAAVLDTLARRDARATFFVLGRQVERHPRLLHRIRDAGHEIGIHGYDHSSRDLGAQARRTRAILRAHGVATRLFRPPRGRLDPRAGARLALAGYRTVLWSFDARDSMRAEGKTRDRIDYARLRPGDIVLLHDDNPVCAGDLDAIIATVRERGLELAPVSELVCAPRADAGGRRPAAGR